MRILGSCFGAEIRQRTVESEGTDSPLVTLLIEDDDNWHEKDVTFDAAWLDDLINVLRATKKTLARPAQRKGKR